MHTMTQSSAKLKNAAELSRSAAAAAPASLPITGFLRIAQIVSDPGDPTATPARPPTHGVIPVCKSTWWTGVKNGRYPQPVKLSPRVTVWRASEVYALFAQTEGG